MATGRFVRIFHARVLAGAIYQPGMVFMLLSLCDMSTKCNSPAIEILEFWDFGTNQVVAGKTGAGSGFSISFTSG
ncbi:MAG: hypothetical protein QF510_06455, partial [Rhodospirillales bacterium]|nr:hypothetical protein [Rhodospirillales bacterium]